MQRRWLEANVRALEEALGAAPECRLCIVSVPPGVQGRELADFLSGAVLAASGHAVVMPEQPNAPAPCRECGIRSNNGTLEAVVSFWTAVGASVAFWLDGLELRGVRLTIRRPPDFSSADGDPSVHLRLNQITLAELLGPVRPQEIPSRSPTCTRAMSNRSDGEEGHTTDEGEVGVERRQKRQRVEGGTRAGVDVGDFVEARELPAAEDLSAEDADADEALGEEWKRQNMLRKALEIHLLKAPRADWIARLIRILMRCNEIPHFMSRVHETYD